MMTNGMTIIERETMLSIQNINKKIIDKRNLIATQLLQSFIQSVGYEKFVEKEDEFIRKAYDTANKMLEYNKTVNTK